MMSIFSVLFFRSLLLLTLCLVLLARITAAAPTPSDLMSLLLQSESATQQGRIADISVQVAFYKAHLAEYGAAIDSFIGPRPWFEVKSEPFEWQDCPEGQEVTVALRRLPSSPYDSILESISQRQYPANCAHRRLKVTLVNGFSSFGNNFFNFNNEAAQSHYAVYVPYINDPMTLHTNFLDPNHCPDTHNKFECAFLPPTNCSLPRLVSHHAFYSNATTTAREISKQSFEHFKHTVGHVDRSDVPMQVSVFGGLVEENGPTEQIIQRHVYQTLFTYGFLFRLNYEFRGRVAREMKRFESTIPSGISFPKDGNCVTINIRKDPDRAPVGTNVTDYCRKCAMGIMHCQPNVFYNYGCQTANPYGAITLQDFIHGAKVISNSTFYYITTDNAQWLQEALGNYTSAPSSSAVQIVPYSAPPNHRKGATVSGVQYLTSLLQARKCSSFVGNSGSAVTALYLNLLSVQHGHQFGGVSPPFFDFSRRRNVPGFDAKWKKLPK
jgi:hypothetical protein